MALGYRPLASAPLASRIPSGSPTAYTLTASPGSVAYQGIAATLLFNRKVVASLGTVTYQGIAAALKFNQKIVAAAGSVTYQGIPATLSYSAADKVLTANVGTITLAGTGATLLYNRLINAAVGHVTYSGATATLLWSGAAPVAPTAQGAGGVAGKRRRAFVKIDEQYFEVRNKREALELLNAAKRTAEEAAKRRASEIVTRPAAEKKEAAPLLALPAVEMGGEEAWVAPMQMQVAEYQRDVQEAYAQALVGQLRGMQERVSFLEDEVESLTLLLEDD